MNIELAKCFYSNGQAMVGIRRILVDGVEWGRIVPKHRGPRGVSYRFMDGFLNPVMNAGENLKKLSSWEVESRRYVAERDPADRRPLDDFFLDEVEKLVKDGLLRDPALLKAEMEAEERERRDRLAQADAKTRQRDLEAAREITAQHASWLTDTARGRLESAIADAIEQGRSR